MHISKMMALAIAWTTIAVNPANASPTWRSEPIAACMRSAAESLGFSGTVYARNGDLVVDRSFGASDVGGKVPNASRTRFNIGSVNKMFTAIAIGRLVDRGALRFDAQIGGYGDADALGLVRSRAVRARARGWRGNRRSG